MAVDPAQRWRNDLTPLLADLERLTERVRALSPPPLPLLGGGDDEDGAPALPDRLSEPLEAALAHYAIGHDTARWGLPVDWQHVARRMAEALGFRGEGFLRAAVETAAVEGEAMDVTAVKVAYGRTVSDGNYGSERVQVGLTATLADDETAVRVVHDLGLQARDVVLAQLRQSSSSFVRAAVATQEERLRRAPERVRVDELDGEEDDQPGADHP